MKNASTEEKKYFEVNIKINIATYLGKTESNITYINKFKSKNS